MEWEKRSVSLLQKISMSFILMSVSVNSLANTIEQDIVNKSVRAYGGQTLLGLKNLTYTDTIKHFFSMQSGHQMQGAMTSHLNEHQIETQIDFVNTQIEFKRLTNRLVGNHGAENMTSTHRLFAKGKGYAIDHCTKTYQPSSRINFDSADIGYSQMLDTLIIKNLANNLDQVKWKDTAMIQGEPHHVLSVIDGEKSQYTIFLNQDSGLLTRMLKKSGGQLRHYDFRAHKKKQGITWAAQMYVSIDKQPLYLTDSKDISFNESPRQYQLPTELTQKQVDQPINSQALTIEKVADGVYFVGQDWGYSLFIDIGEYYISMGAWHFEDSDKPYQRSLALLRQETGHNKPIKQHIVTHHHTDHMAGLKGIVNSGTRLVIHQPDVDSVKTHLDETSGLALSDNQIIAVSLQAQTITSLIDKKVMLFDLPTSHASHNLMVYLPEQKILFSEDIFGSSDQNHFDAPNSWPTLDTYQRLKKLHEKINQLNLDVEQFVSSHHKRVLSKTEIKQALSISCPASQQLKLLH